jgi:hypothetical protein
LDVLSGGLGISKLDFPAVVKKKNLSKPWIRILITLNAGSKSTTLLIGVNLLQMDQNYYGVLGVMGL